jgi:hypothetical protein
MENDLKALAQKFFTAYDSQDIDGMIACFADDAEAWYAPYGRDSVMPIRGGIDAIWRTLQKIPDLHVNAGGKKHRCSKGLGHWRAAPRGRSRHYQKGTDRSHTSSLLGAHQ